MNPKNLVVSTCVLDDIPSEEFVTIEGSEGEIFLLIPYVDHSAKELAEWILQKFQEKGELKWTLQEGGEHEMEQL